MSKVSRRPRRQQIKETRKARKKADKALRLSQRAEGLKVPFKASIANRKCPYDSVEEEKQARLDATTEQVKIFRANERGQVSV